MMANGIGRCSQAVGSAVAISKWFLRGVALSSVHRCRKHRHPGKAERPFTAYSFLFVLSELPSMLGSDANRSMSSAYIIY